MAVPSMATFVTAMSWRGGCNRVLLFVGGLKDLVDIGHELTTMRT